MDQPHCEERQVDKLEKSRGLVGDLLAHGRALIYSLDHEIDEFWCASVAIFARVSKISLD